MYIIRVGLLLCSFWYGACVQAFAMRYDKPITMDFQDIPVRSALQTLAEFVGMNLVVSDAVTGNITLKLHDVPWNEALDMMLKTQQLEKRQQGSIVFIDTVSAFSARKRQALEDQLAAEKLMPLQAQLLQLNYAKADDIVTALNNKNHSFLSERGSLQADARTNSIWIQDSLSHIKIIKQLLTQLDVPSKQVQIEARLVNMTKDCANDLGVRWGLSSSKAISGTLNAANQLAKGLAVSDIPVADRLNIDLSAIPFDANPASIGIALIKLSDNVLLDLELSALESEGRAEIIASPRLMTSNQQTAVIESGEDIPYQEATLSGATAVAFKKAVLSLKVTPQITPNGQLLMELQINEDSDSGRRVHGVPILFTKSIETRVMVNNGQTLVLGGIRKQHQDNGVARVPFLGTLPVVGALFSRKQVRKRQEELLIFITPTVITGKSSLRVES